MIRVHFLKAISSELERQNLLPTRFHRPFSTLITFALDLFGADCSFALARLFDGMGAKGHHNFIAPHQQIIGLGHQLYVQFIEYIITLRYGHAHLDVENLCIQPTIDYRLRFQIIFRLQLLHQPQDIVPIFSMAGIELHNSVMTILSNLYRLGVRLGIMAPAWPYLSDVVNPVRYQHNNWW